MGLLDIAPPEIVTRKFEVRGGTLEVRGITNKEYVILLRRFPEWQKQLNGEDVDLTEMVDQLLSAVIAAGLGAIGDEETEALVIDRLTDSERTIVFRAIMELTSPQSSSALRPLADGRAPAKLNGGANANHPTETTNSPQPSLL